MRKVAFVVFDIDNSIIDRFNLDVITGINGVGFKLKISTIDGDIESTVTKVVQEKQSVNFKIHFINHAYEKSAILEQWIGKYSAANKRLALEYDDGLRRRYCEGKVVELKKEEKDEYSQLVRNCVFKPLTPFFSHIENTIKIHTAAKGKSYPYSYPYSYGKNIVENNMINNTYLLDVPVTITISGSVFEPDVSLLDENGQMYNRVRFPGITLLEDEYIIINSADCKIWGYTIENGLEDWTAKTDPAFDTFFRAQSGISTILFEQSETCFLTGSWRQYGL